MFFSWVSVRRKCIPLLLGVACLVHIIVPSQALAAWAHSANGTVATGQGTTAAVQPAWPAHSTGHTGFAFVAYRGLVAPPTTVSGWTLIHSDINVAALTTLQVWCRVATSGSEAAPSFGWSGEDAPSDTAVAYISTFTGGSCTQGATASSDNNDGFTADATIPYDAHTPTENNDLVLIGVYWNDSNITSFDLPSGFTALPVGVQPSGSDVSVAAWYQVQTTATAISAGTITESGGALEVHLSIIASIQAATASLTFDTAPAVDTCTDTGCDITYDDAGSGNTLAWMLVGDGDTAPADCDAIIAASGSRGDGTDVSTGGADSFAATATDVPEQQEYDWYGCLDDDGIAGGTQSTVVSLTSTFVLSAPAGFQFVTLTSVVAGSPPGNYNDYISGVHAGGLNEAVLSDTTDKIASTPPVPDWSVDQWIGYTVQNTTDGSSCTITDSAADTVTCTLSGGTDNDWDTNDAYVIGALIAANDYLLVATMTTPGTGGTAAALTVNADGSFEYTGDGFQQSASPIYVWDDTTNDWHADQLAYVNNNTAPDCEAGPGIAVLQFEPWSLDFTGIVDDIDGDTLTFTTLDALPNNTTLTSAGLWASSPDPDTENEAGTDLTFTAADPWGGTCDVVIETYVVNTVTVSSYLPEDEITAPTVYSAERPWDPAFEFLTLVDQCSSAEAAGEVIAQDPAATTEAGPFDGVTVTLASVSVCGGAGSNKPGVTFPGLSMPGL